MGIEDVIWRSGMATISRKGSEGMRKLDDLRLNPPLLAGWRAHWPDEQERTNALRGPGRHMPFVIDRQNCQRPRQSVRTGDTAWAGLLPLQRSEADTAAVGPRRTKISFFFFPRISNELGSMALSLALFFTLAELLHRALAGIEAGY